MSSRYERQRSSVARGRTGRAWPSAAQCSDRSLDSRSSAARPPSCPPSCPTLSARLVDRPSYRAHTSSSTRAACSRRCAESVARLGPSTTHITRPPAAPEPLTPDAAEDLLGPRAKTSVQAIVDAPVFASLAAHESHTILRPDERPRREPVRDDDPCELKSTPSPCSTRRGQKMQSSRRSRRRLGLRARGRPQPSVGLSERLERCAAVQSPKGQIRRDWSAFALSSTAALWPSAMLVEPSEDQLNRWRASVAPLTDLAHNAQRAARARSVGRLRGPAALLQLVHAGRATAAAVGDCWRGRDRAVVRACACRGLGHGRRTRHQLRRRHTKRGRRAGRTLVSRAASHLHDDSADNA